jgi:hypothetical protein
MGGSPVAGMAVCAAPEGMIWVVTGRNISTCPPGRIELPVLVTSGRYAEMTAGLVEPVMAGIKGAGQVVFHGNSDLAMAEESDRYRAVLGFFLGRVEAAGTALPAGR